MVVGSTWSMTITEQRHFRVVYADLPDSRSASDWASMGGVQVGASALGIATVTWVVAERLVNLLALVGCIWTLTRQFPAPGRRLAASRKGIYRNRPKSDALSCILTLVPDCRISAWSPGTLIRFHRRPSTWLNKKEKETGSNDISDRLRRGVRIHRQGADSGQVGLPWLFRVFDHTV